MLSVVFWNKASVCWQILFCFQSTSEGFLISMGSASSINMERASVSSDSPQGKFFTAWMTYSYKPMTNKRNCFQNFWKFFSKRKKIVSKSKLALLATQQANKFGDKILRQEITETGGKKAADTLYKNDRA